eukprot:scaffold12636_cov176-Amphora_coffeaeformis.AAC.4
MALRLRDTLSGGRAAENKLTWTGLCAGGAGRLFVRHRLNIGAVVRVSLDSGVFRHSGLCEKANEWKERGKQCLY